MMPTLFTTKNLDRYRRASRWRWRLAFHSVWLVPLLLLPFGFVTARGIEPSRVFGGGSKIPENLKLDGVARIEADSRLGTGFLVAENVVLTAAHVTEATASITVVFNFGKPDEARISGKIIASGYDAFRKSNDIQDDWALVEIETPRSTEHVYGLDDSSLAQQTQRVWAVGFPLGGDLNVSGGVVSGVREDRIVTDAAIDPGYSGGPLFSADSGLVLGIISSVAVDPRDQSRAQSLHFAVPINDVADKCDRAGRPIK